MAARAASASAALAVRFTVLSASGVAMSHAAPNPTIPASLR
jgi:uncharacterized MnhB-related membrane protein